MRLSLTVSLILAIVGEMIASQNGLGQAILQAARSFRSAELFAGVVLLGLIGFASNALLSLGRAPPAALAATPDTPRFQPPRSTHDPQASSTSRCTWKTTSLRPARPGRRRSSYIDHQMSSPDLAQFFPGLKQEDLPDGEAWAVEDVQLNTHNGTHLDAPYHFASTQDGRRQTRTDDRRGRARTGASSPP